MVAISSSGSGEGLGGVISRGYSTRVSGFVPYPHGVALAKEIPGATLLTMKGVGHELPRGVWHEIVPAILDHTALAAS